MVRALAALLQAPFVSPSRAATYGALGGLLAHEMNHGFDDTGRLFGPDLSMRSWWDDEVVANYTERAACLAQRCGCAHALRTRCRARARKQTRTAARAHFWATSFLRRYAAYSVLGHRVSGNRTVGEDIADFGG